MNDKKPYVVACAVLAMDIKQAAEKKGLDLGFKFLEGGLHNSPDRLRKKLQAAINELEEQENCDRIIVGYGVCGRGSIGIRAGRLPLSIPKVHDCIAMFLGGDAPYMRQFRKHPGTYYISAGWHEENKAPLSQQKKWTDYGEERLNYDNLVEEYGVEAAGKTFQFLNSWQKNYRRAAFIETGAGRSPKYENHAREMAAEYGWEYEKIQGDPALIEKLLPASETCGEILVVPPGHIIGFDARNATLSADPLWEQEEEVTEGPRITVVDDENGEERSDFAVGLGIDAGGTYTDTVIYDLGREKTLCKSKALTTKWDFTIGIAKALSGLDQEQLKHVEMVALSTTLATNAIVEGEGQKVGVILMPPGGIFEAKDFPYETKAVVEGRLTISGRETEPVNPGEVRKVVRRMVEKDEVAAFAVSGFAGAVNPAHELAVKRIIREETGLFVTCGHELSNILDFKVRASTAMLNARIVPRLGRLIEDLSRTLESVGITAPMMVVKGDGTLMSDSMARERPVETILSGPAASVAGARRLTGLTHALVVDMGGTTSDTAMIENDVVRLCERGSSVGGQRTHVKALEIRTTGLGGDSLIRREKEKFQLGPRRVSPIAWLGANHAGTDQAVNYLHNRLNKFTGSTAGMEFLALTGSADHLKLSPLENRIVTLLASRPHSIHELVGRTGVMIEKGLSLERLEEHFVVGRCGLTPTDLLHLTGSFNRWDKEAVENYCGLFGKLAGEETGKMAEDLLAMVTERLALELLKRQLDEETDSDALDDCPVCNTLLKNLFSGGGNRYRVRIDMKYPVVGIGAPIGYFLPKAAEAMGASFILPDDADVANAVGAITSKIEVKRFVRIIPGCDGGFRIEGLTGNRQFRAFEEADSFARKELTRNVREQALAAGTFSRAVELTWEDQTPASGCGRKIFIGRIIHAKLTGRPHIAGIEHSADTAA